MNNLGKREPAKAFGYVCGVLLFFGVIFGACMGCREIVVLTGRAIVQP